MMAAAAEAQAAGNARFRSTLHCSREKKAPVRAGDRTRAMQLAFEFLTANGDTDIAGKLEETARGAQNESPYCTLIDRVGLAEAFPIASVEESAALLIVEARNGSLYQNENICQAFYSWMRFKRLTADSFSTRPSDHRQLEACEFINQAEERSLFPIPFRAISQTLSVQLLARQFISLEFLAAAVVSTLPPEELARRRFYFLRNLLLIDKAGFSINSMTIEESLGDQAARATVVFLGQIEQYTLPYIRKARKRSEINLLVVIDAGWISFREAGVLVDRGFLFTPDSIRFVVASRPIFIDYVFNKTKRLDSRLRSAGISLAADPLFEFIVADKALTSAILIRAEVRIPAGITFLTDVQLKKRPAFEHTMLYSAPQRLCVVHEGDKEAVARAVRSLPAGSLVTKPSRGQKGSGVRLDFNNTGEDDCMAVARYVMQIIASGDAAIVEQRIIPPSTADWNVRVFVTGSRSGQDLAGCDAMVDELDNAYVIELNGNNSGGADKLQQFNERAMIVSLVDGMVSRALASRLAGSETLELEGAVVSGMYVRKHDERSEQPVNVAQGASVVQWSKWADQLYGADAARVDAAVCTEILKAFDAVMAVVWHAVEGSNRNIASEHI